MFRSKWRKRAEDTFRELVIAENRIQALENNIVGLNEIHSFVEDAPIAKIVLDLRYEMQKNNLKPTKVFLRTGDMDTFFANSPLCASMSQPQGIGMLYGLTVFYTAGEIRVE
jgi:hypothetical protein